MLITVRRSGDKLRIGDEVVITVVDVGRRQVRLGVEAPANVIVVRQELLEARARQAAPAAPCAECRNADPHACLAERYPQFARRPKDRCGCRCHRGAS